MAGPVLNCVRRCLLNALMACESPSVAGAFLMHARLQLFRRRFDRAERDAFWRGFREDLKWVSADEFRAPEVFGAVLMDLNRRAGSVVSEDDREQI